MQPPSVMENAVMFAEKTNSANFSEFTSMNNT